MARDIVNVTIAGNDPVAYKGEAWEPELTLTDGAKTLVLNTDYVVTYDEESNVNVTNASPIVIDGIGRYNTRTKKYEGYAGETNVTFEITNRVVTITAASHVYRSPKATMAITLAREDSAMLTKLLPIRIALSASS